MKRTIVARSLASLLSLFALAAAAAPGCTDLKESCPAGETYWLCTALISERSTPSCYCEGPRDYTDWVCASNDFMAWNAMEMLVNVRMGTIALANKGCHDTGSATPSAIAPKFKAETQASCDADAADDGCVTCAKAACCSSYQACLDDPNCACLVDCIGVGNTVAVCTMPANCGAADGVSTTTAACLNDACHAQCLENLGSMGGACTCGGATSSGPGGGGLGAGGSPFGGGGSPFGGGSP